MESNWIKIQDRTPDWSGVNVIVAYKFGVCEAKFYPIIGKFKKFDDEVPEVTHWMPLPDPPRQELDLNNLPF